MKSLARNAADLEQRDGPKVVDSTRRHGHPPKPFLLNSDTSLAQPVLLQRTINTYEINSAREREKRGPVLLRVDKSYEFRVYV